MKAKDLSNEDLATILRSICVTGICPSRDEKEYLQEAADRLEQKSETVTEFADRCRECGKSYIRIPDNATNGDVIKVIFPNAKIVETDREVFLYTGTREKDEDIQIFDTEWWNAPYQKGGK